MLVPETANSFHVTAGARRFLDESEGVSFRVVFLLEDRCMQLLLEILGKHMRKAGV
jgi:hypothetical protein